MDNSQESGVSIVNSLSLVIVLGYALAIPMWMWWPPTKVPPEILAIINQMMGAWGMAFATVVAFHLGSSRSTKDAAQANREALSTMSTAMATSTAAVAAAAAPLNGAATITTVTTPATTTTTTGPVEPGETAAWTDAEKANTVDGFRDYIAKFPTGVHVPDATRRIAALPST